jgi:4-amino-4-deoxy-L-arabinose transferase-like glycosyltransferase
LILVRLLLFLALAAIGAALLLWLIKRDRRYLRFIGLTLKFTVIALLAILVWFAAERLWSPIRSSRCSFGKCASDSAPVLGSARPRSRNASPTPNWEMHLRPREYRLVVMPAS